MRPSSAQSGNAQAARPTSRSSHSGQSNGWAAVTAQPISTNDGFDFRKAEAVQCVGGRRYTVPPNCFEREFFTQLAAEVFEAAEKINTNYAWTEKQSRMVHFVTEQIEKIRALCEEGDKLEALMDLLQLRDVAYTQLRLMEHPVVSARDPPANDLSYVPEHFFETYYVSKNSRDFPHVQAPAGLGGRHYEVQNTRSWPWSFVLTFRVYHDEFDEDSAGGAAMRTVDHAFQLKLGYRRQEHCYNDQQNPREQVVKLTIGEMPITGGPFCAWEGELLKGEIAVADQELTQKLFFQKQWMKAMKAEMAGETGAPIMADVEDSPVPDGPVLQFDFEVHDERLCVVRKAKGDADGEPALLQVANFFVVRVLNMFQSTDGAHKPWMKLLCRLMHDPCGSGTVYLSSADQVRAPLLSGFKYLDVEVHVEASRLKSGTEVRSLFMQSHVSLQTCLTLAQFNCYIGLFLEHPEPTACVAYLGRQTDQRTFVAGNCCFRDGQIMTHAEAGYEIIPEFFAEHLTPLTRLDFPQHVLIPYPHVRFSIATRVWNELMPAFFKNNLLPAQATLAMAVAGLQTTKVWAGQTGLGHGFPTTWVFSNEPNTGKTEATLLCQSMLGFFHRAPWAGDATKSAMFERFSQQSDISVVVDDVVVSDNSRMYAQLGRALYDRTTRAVTGKIRQPHCSAIFTVRAPPPTAARTRASRRTRRTHRTRSPPPCSPTPRRTPPRTAHRHGHTARSTPGRAGSRAAPRRPGARTAASVCPARPAPPRRARAPCNAAACAHNSCNTCTPWAAHARPSDRTPAPARPQ